MNRRSYYYVANWTFCCVQEKLLMESAADTNRIERNMKRVAAYLGIPEEKLHIDIRWTMLMVNVSDEKHSFSKFQKV